MRSLHVASEISGWTAERHAQKLEHQLIVLAHAIAALALPVDAELWIAGQPRHEVCDKRGNHIMTAEALVERGLIRIQHRFLLQRPHAALSSSATSSIRISTSQAIDC